MVTKANSFAASYPASIPESVELPPSGDGPSTKEWVLVGVAESSQLGSTERLAELEKIKRKAEHGNIL